ncbi:hypothetical protein NQ318_016837 [Aromia moschata]|uniref:UEV domain-containing protein n=1 Tax=Aromia moschata TaxID=1265417 RepID=A0AAV8YW27_9CUCU|nr:hypothetical protein NQ318_016837 [Aromia moschata]
MVDNERLRQWITNYHNPDVVNREILTVTNQYRGLHPEQDVYTFNDGTPMELVNLSGTIPCVTEVQSIIYLYAFGL